MNITTLTYFIFAAIFYGMAVLILYLLRKLQEAKARKEIEPLAQEISLGFEKLRGSEEENFVALLEQFGNRITDLDREKLVAFVKYLVRKNQLPQAITFSLVRDHRAVIEGLPVNDLKEISAELKELAGTDAFTLYLVGPAYLKKRYNMWMVNRWVRSRNPLHQRVALLSTISVDNLETLNPLLVNNALERCRKLIASTEPIVINARLWVIAALKEKQPAALLEFERKSHLDFLFSKTKKASVSVPKDTIITGFSNLSPAETKFVKLKLRRFKLLVGVVEKRIENFVRFVFILPLGLFLGFIGFLVVPFFILPKIVFPNWSGTFTPEFILTTLITAILSFLVVLIFWVLIFSKFEKILEIYAELLNISIDTIFIGFIVLFGGFCLFLIYPIYSLIEDGLFPIYRLIEDGRNLDAVQFGIGTIIVLNTFFFVCVPGLALVAIDDWIISLFKRLSVLLLPQEYLAVRLHSLVEKLESKPLRWDDIAFKNEVVSSLEKISWICENTFSRKMRGADIETSLWLRNNFVGIAEAFRSKKKLVFSPSPSSRTGLISSLTKSALLVVNGNWGQLEMRPVVSPGLREGSWRWVKGIWAALKAIIISLIPLSLVIAAEKTQVLNNSIQDFGVPKLIAIAWLAVSLIVAVDPLYSNKFDFIGKLKNVLSSKDEGP